MKNFGNYRVCESFVDLANVASTSVTIDGQTLTLAKAAPKRVVIIGDAGCRVTGGHHPQKCYAPFWIFDQVADAAKKVVPGLIIHVGDYVYRYNCYNGNQGCGAQSQLTEWKYWSEDFFAPAKNLLTVAPWVFVRGNHENCNRGGMGWSLFFKTTPGTNCSYIEPPYIANLPDSKGSPSSGMNLIVTDTSDEAPPGPGAYDFVKNLSGANWILTHVPLWSAHAEYRHSVPASVGLAISGHEHLFELVQRLPSDPAQVVQGASGTRLENAGYHRWPNYQYHEATDFSFAIIDQEKAQWGKNVTLTLCGVRNSQSATVIRQWAINFNPASGKWNINARAATPSNYCTTPQAS